MSPIMSKSEAAAHIDSARIRQGRTWAELAEHLGAPLVWTTSALLGQHPLTTEQARSVCELLGLGEDVAEWARPPAQPWHARGTDGGSDDLPLHRGAVGLRTGAQSVDP